MNKSLQSFLKLSKLWVVVETKRVASYLRPGRPRFTALSYHLALVGWTQEGQHLVHFLSSTVRPEFRSEVISKVTSEVEIVAFLVAQQGPLVGAAAPPSTLLLALGPGWRLKARLENKEC